MLITNFPYGITKYIDYVREVPCGLVGYTTPYA